MTTFETARLRLAALQIVLADTRGELVKKHDGSPFKAAEALVRWAEVPGSPAPDQASG